MSLEKKVVDLTKEASSFLRELPRIPELDFTSQAKYEAASKKEILNPFLEDSDVIIVAGSYFGDEGKGKMTAAIAGHPAVELVMRSNSGENAGHTVMHKGRKFVFHLTPSGILMAGKKSLIGPECAMDPVSFMEKEIAPLQKSKIDYSRLYVGNVHIVTPYHKLMDLLGSPKNSSTLKGISPAHAAKAAKRGLRLNHLFNSEEEQGKRLRRDLASYEGLLHTQKVSENELLELCRQINRGQGQKVPEHIIKFLEAGRETDNKINYLITLFRKAVVDNPDFPKRADAAKIVSETLAQGKKILLEAPQSFFLSNAVETHWSSATSANTTAAGVMASAGYNCFQYRTKVINVHKTPGSSRVGLGANPAAFVPQDFFSCQGIDSLHPLAGICEDFPKIQRQYFASILDNGIFLPTTFVDTGGEEYDINVAMAVSSAKFHDEKGATTGKPRVLGLFDCVAHHKVNLMQGPYLSLSAMDRGDDYETVGLVVAYVVCSPDGLPSRGSSSNGLYSNGRIYRSGDVIRPGDSLPCEQVLQYCHPIIKVMDGWKNAPISAGKRDLFDSLPRAVQDFLGAVEHYTGAEIISIGNGPRTEDLVYVKKVGPLVRTSPEDT